MHKSISDGELKPRDENGAATAPTPRHRAGRRWCGRAGGWDLCTERSGDEWVLGVREGPAKEIEPEKAPRPSAARRPPCGPLAAESDEPTIVRHS